MKNEMKGLVAAAVFALAAPAFAVDTGTSGQAGKSLQQPSAQSHTAYTGVVKEIDQDKKLVTLQLPLAPNASIMKDGQKVSLSDVKEGDDVRASFDPQSKKIIRLDVQTKAAPAEPGFDNR